ncbi:DUF937 domain-containing protein [Ahrensia sp. 13_GOM-1096m]|uniref:DUF937 domain-containing protein n=1 Tax=Ahrensia sp. 13_GOM-1096m TaxID=1380380 RepID=UPI00047D4F22|nr:DUF937 domain-containing protein [Ahrensia sp. 13_GOM-1096m]
MLPIFDMLTKAQNGNAIDMMAEQFGLSAKQTQDALEALTPAFSTGLKRNAAEPMGVAGFMQALASGNHAKYFEDMQSAFQPQGLNEGNGILGHLFGSKDVSRAVAEQAAKATGIGPDILKQMLPVIASTLMGAMYKQTTQPQAFGVQNAGNGNILGQIIEQMMQHSGQASPQAAPRNSNPMDNPFGKALQDMFGGNQTQQQSAPNPMDPTNNPFGKIFEDMMGGPKPAPEPAPTKNKYEDLFGDMFETGRKQQDQYQKSVESIFDQYINGMNRHK